ncbi:hypothetical protein NC652_015667 [Populus alba x Populus x berolinensis]|nr:hypothetical protein NC652_015660 [Populus alba x Populus x berolinensis]KAJ6921791.1 hypothetical protein NC652_015667 [Populus alba x Populus x berolinensis]
MAEAAQVSFKTPWSTVAVMAAAFAIRLSTLQTWEDFGQDLMAA